MAKKPSCEKDQKETELEEALTFTSNLATCFMMSSSVKELFPDKRWYPRLASRLEVCKTCGEVDCEEVHL